MGTEMKEEKSSKIIDMVKTLYLDVECTRLSYMCLWFISGHKTHLN